MTELIFRELRLRKFDGVAPLTSPRCAQEVDVGGESGRRPPDPHGIERLAVRHSRRRAQPDELRL